jgi:ribosomal peptide maturation radical SAM protein 1
MFRVALINMPFASLNLPSIGLTQIENVLGSTYGEKVATEVHYFNHEFAHYLGLDSYKNITSSMNHHNSGFGEWFFRQVAFPEQADNSEKYFGRYYPQKDEAMLKFKSHMLSKREGLTEMLDGLIDKYKLDEANVVGLTSMFSQHVASLAMARRLKERNPNVITVMGGANCESPMGQEIAKNIDYVDFLFSGPGLKSFTAFVGHCLEGDTEQCHAIKGVISRRNCTETQGALPMLGQKPQGVVMGEELDINAGVKLDYGAFLDAVEREFPNREVEPILLFETSRGCWWGERAHCTFCGLNGVTMSYRAMSPERAIEQFESMFAYSDRVSRINCVDNILAKNYMTDVFPKLNTPANVKLFYEVKADLSEEEMEVLAEAGVKTVQPGVESLATSTLKLMKKGISSFSNVFFLKNCVTYDIHPEWNLLVGFPGEGEDVYKKYIEDMPLLAHLPPPSGVFPVRFDRYSPYFMKAKEYELQLKPVDYYEMTYPFSKESINSLAYYFSDHNYGAKYFLMMARWINKMRVKFEAWEARWSSRNYAVPPQLFLVERDGVSHIYDSRSGEAVEYEISEATAMALGMMHDKPKRVADLGKILGHLPGFDAATTMNFLKERGLVFQEGDRYIALVLYKERLSARGPRAHVKQIEGPALPGVQSFR